MSQVKKNNFYILLQQRALSLLHFCRNLWVLWFILLHMRFPLQLFGPMITHGQIQYFLSCLQLRTKVHQLNRHIDYRTLFWKNRVNKVILTLLPVGKYIQATQTPIEWLCWLLLDGAHSRRVWCVDLKHSERVTLMQLLGLGSGKTHAPTWQFWTNGYLLASASSITWITPLSSRPNSYLVSWHLSEAIEITYVHQKKKMQLLSCLYFSFRQSLIWSKKSIQKAKLKANKFRCDWRAPYKSYHKLPSYFPTYFSG